MDDLFTCSSWPLGLMVTSLHADQEFPGLISDVAVGFCSRIIFLDLAPPSLMRTVSDLIRNVDITRLRGT